MKDYFRRALMICLTTVTLLCLCTYVHASPAEAAEQARSSTGGKVLKVKSRKDGTYRVKILMPNGQVRSISVGGSKNDLSEKK